MSSPVKEFAQARAVGWVVTAVAALVVIVLKEVVPPILPEIEEALTKRGWMGLLALSVVLNVILGAYVYFSSRGPRLKLAFGALWDSKKNTYCLVCKTPTIYENFEFHGWSLHCPKCNKSSRLNDEGDRISLKDAKARL